jgi:uncharacterized membrane protein (UPF0127 family)
MEPRSLELHNTSEPYGFGLEVNQGWFEEHAIGAGDVVELPPALRAEGCD